MPTTPRANPTSEDPFEPLVIDEVRSFLSAHAVPKAQWEDVSEYYEFTVEAEGTPPTEAELLSYLSGMNLYDRHPA